MANSKKEQAETPDEKKEEGNLTSKEACTRALERVQEEYDSIQRFTSNLREKWLRWYELYRMFRLTNGSTHNRVFIPKAFEVVEKIAPRITAHDPIYQMVPLSNEAVKDLELAGEWLKYMWEEDKLRRQARLMAKGAQIMGTSFVKLFMKPVTKKEIVSRTVTEENEMGEQITEEVEEEIELKSLPTFRVVDIFDIAVDPKCESIEDAPAVIHSRDSVRYRELLEEEDLYFNLDMLEELAEPVTQGMPEEKRDKLEARGINADVGKTELDLTNLLVREYWGLFSPTGEAKDEAEYVITTVNDAIVIRLERNPYATDSNPDGVRPIELCVDHDVPNELYGIGEIEPTETLHIGINKIRNQRLDNVDLVMNRMWKYDRSAGINPKHLKSFPGNIIPMDDMEGLQALPTPDVTSSSYAEEDRFSRDFQQVTGVVDVTDQGGSQGFTNTATGQKIREKESTRRFQLKIDNLEDSLSRIGSKMLKMLHALDEDFYIIRRKSGDSKYKFTKVKKTVLDRIVDGMDVTVKAGSTVSDDYEERRNDAIAQWNLSAAAFNAGVIPKEALKEVWVNMMRVAFKQFNLSEKALDAPVIPQLQKGMQMPQLPGMPQEQGPVQAKAEQQINPETLTPNGMQAGLPINTN
jgi:hypothetical protein